MHVFTFPYCRLHNNLHTVDSACAEETHSTDAGGQNHPAPLDKEDGFVANHVLDV